MEVGGEFVQYLCVSAGLCVYDLGGKSTRKTTHNHLKILCVSIFWKKPNCAWRWLDHAFLPESPGTLSFPFIGTLPCLTWLRSLVQSWSFPWGRGCVPIWKGGKLRVLICLKPRSFCSPFPRVLKMTRPQALLSLCLKTGALSCVVFCFMMRHNPSSHPKADTFTSHAVSSLWF